MTPVEPITGPHLRHPMEDRPTGRAPQPFVEIDRLSLYYREKPAFQDVTLSINKGCITALVGPSGCGKTSFLTCLNRLTDLIAGCRVSGRIRIDALDVLASGTDVIQLRRRIGMIFQKPNPFPLTIRRNLELPLREHGMRDRAQIAQIIETTLRDVGLWDEVKDRLDWPALILSGGQQQRLCIARALALLPEVLLMDEPCSALDPLSSGVVDDLIVSLRCRYTILIVTHNLAQARRIADYAALFWIQNAAGRLIKTGTAKQMFEEPRDPLTAAYVSGMRG
jgi:phosphate transport system ATP-binding protein